MTNWVRMKHNETNGYTLVAERSVPGYEKRGWAVDSGDDKSALSHPAPKANPKPIRSEKVKEDPQSSDSNDSKEDG